MAAVCRNTGCTEVDVEKWDGMIPEGEPIHCGGCWELCERNDTRIAPPWEQVPEQHDG